MNQLWDGRRDAAGHVNKANTSIHVAANHHHNSTTDDDNGDDEHAESIRCRRPPLLAGTPFPSLVLSLKR